MTFTPPPDDLSDLVQRLEASSGPPPAAPQAHPPIDVPPGRRESRSRMARRRRITAIVASIIAVVLLGGGATAWAVMANRGGEIAPTETAAPKPTAAKPAPSPSPAPAETPKPEPEPEPEPAPVAGPDLDSPSSITVVVNKQRPLSPITWVPDDLAQPAIPNSSGQPLRYEAAVALEQMYAEANAAGLPFAIVSGFRSYELQTSLFNNYSAGYGVDAAETFSARPGHSEHQTGLAVDISECLGCALSEAFGSTPQGLWARENAHRFGFILRYDQGQQPVVGYVYEPWHFRYVGVDIATDMRNRGIINLEEYFGLPAAPTY